MKIVALVPSRLNSERIPKKNIKLLGKIPLVNYCIKTLQYIDVKNIILYASDDKIEDFINEEYIYRFVQRPQYLDNNESGIQDILKEFLKINNADIIVLHHITSPFIKVDTIRECIEKVKSGEYDSAFTALKIQNFCWFKDKPLNYCLRIPRTQDIEPVIIETGFYVFKRELFEQTEQRIGLKPYIKYVGSMEGLDIDTKEDFKLAKLILKLNECN